MTSRDEDTGPRVALVTGASRGIGCAVAEALASVGHHVVLASRNETDLDTVRASIERAGGAASVQACDVADGAAVTGLVEGVTETHGRLDILVNNAGMTRDGLLLRMKDEDFDDVIAVNLRAAFLACRAAVRTMMRHRWGRIVNISSVTALRGNPGQANYAAAKAGLMGFTRTLAREYGGKGITANVIAPGFIATAMTDRLDEAVREAATRTIPLQRFGTPAEVAHAVAYLTSEEAAYVTGHVLLVDGGLLC